MRDWEVSLDRWLTTPPEPEEVFVAYCLHCESEIYAGDEVYKVADGMVHDECFSDYAKEELDASWDVAEAPEPDEPEWNREDW